VPLNSQNEVRIRAQRAGYDELGGKVVDGRVARLEYAPAPWRVGNGTTGMLDAER